MTAHRYKIFGLSVASEIALPALGANLPAFGEAADVIVEIGKVGTTTLPPPTDYRIAGDNRILLTIENVASYEIVAGERIVLRAWNGADPAAVNVYLLGSVFGALLHQRRLLPLHASAALYGDTVVAFSGPIGAGKSTMAAALMQRGRRILADDVLAIHPMAEGPFLAFPGIPQIKVCSDVLAGLALGNADDWPINRASEKHHIPHAGPAPGRGLPLRRIYFLEAGTHQQGLEIEPLSAFEGLQCLRANIYRGRLLGLLGIESRFLGVAAALLRRIDCYRLRRPCDFATMPAVLDALERHLDD